MNCILGWLVWRSYNRRPSGAADAEALREEEVAMTARSWQGANTSRVIILGAMLGASAGALALAGDPQPEVLVVSALGDWRQVAPYQMHAKQKPVSFGQRLDVGSGCLYGAAEGAIVLKYATASDNTLYAFPCEKPPSVQNPDCTAFRGASCTVNLKKLGNKKGVISGFVADLSDTLARLLSAQPERYMVASSRGIEDELNDAVVPLDNGEADLSVVFRGMPAGKYYVEFQAVDARVVRGAPLPVVSAKNQKAVVAGPALHPGLYKVLLVDQKGEPAGSDAWIVLAAAADYPVKAAAFQKALEESAKLPAEMDPSATRALLRAYLESLSEHAQATRP
jgi:hypothetical protein